MLAELFFVSLTWTPLTKIPGSMHATLPYLTLPNPTLPYLTRPYPTLPYPTLPICAL